MKESSSSVKNTMLKEVLTGLNLPQKTLPSKYFYDEKGSALFDEICELDEYYPTRTEMKIMEDNIEDISFRIGEKCVLVELGSGSSIKIRLLIDHLDQLVAYVPVDISSEHLHKAIEGLKSDHANLNVYAVVADYTKQFTLPVISEPYKSVDAFYPGSTIGNFTPEEAWKFLKRIASICGKESGLLIGVDLIKDENILNAAYNDAKNITAQFNLNILNHINNEIGSDFNIDQYEHFAFYNKKETRIEMHLKSLTEQVVKIDGSLFTIKKDETILTEYSYKYSTESFKELVKGVYEVEKVWTDKNNLFSVQFLRSI